MASLKFALGMIPSTAKIEQLEKALAEEYAKLTSFTESKELARYKELDALVNSAGFRQEKKELESLTYTGSDEFNKEREFNKLASSGDIKLYLKTREGNELKKFRELDGSDKIKHFEELQKYISSPEFRQKEKMKPITFRDSEEYRKFMEYKTIKKSPEAKKPDKHPGSPKLERLRELEAYISSPEFIAKKNMKPVTFRDTAEYAKLQEYKTLKASPEIKGYYAFLKSKEYANFRKIDGSAMFARYEELKAWLATPGFTERKSYLLDKKRYEKTEMFAQLREYETLKKSDDIIWYFKVKDSDKFDTIKKREVTFSEEFDKDKLDGNKWLTGYYWGEKLLNDNYSLEGDLHIHTRSGNFDIRSSVLSISTKPQKTEGKVWSPKSGFARREFSYTSGQINTAKSFRQKYGTFSAKIKLDNPSARSAFWLLGDTMTPHIDICRTGKGKVWFDIFRSEKSAAKASIPGKFAGEFYIYTLEWTPDKLVWKVNGEEAFVQTGNIPQEPMYISVAGGTDVPLGTVANTEIDWVRVYKML
ncbi:MAG: glycoside hydrolase family 16 protein [Bacteroidetes bacterium]|nr:glycoside hydrolase family 16 protein [Bacteroidota bacterium]